ncbi:MAG: DNA polymerase III subunit beta, partial [Veillonella sp.]|nr:DNA polymerase III subunit beta [Veillonella sp.]
MHITFTKENLLHVVNVLQKVSQNKTSSNLPGAIYMTTKDNKVEFQANDFELGMKISIDATIQEPGTAVLSSYNFNTFVQKSPDSTITINKPEDSNKVTLASGTAEFNFVTINPEDFALVEQIHNENQIDLDTDTLKELIDLTTYAAATEDDRPVFQGALLEINENEVTMVATDTHRMAVKKVTIESPVAAPVRCIIPTKTLAEISRLLPKNNPSIVNIVWNRTQIVFMFENVYVISRLIEGTYPDYEKVIPAQFDSSAIINRKE